MIIGNKKIIFETYGNKLENILEISTHEQIYDTIYQINEKLKTIEKNL